MNQHRTSLSLALSPSVPLLPPLHCPHLGLSLALAHANDDVVDRDEEELDEEADEAHDREANRRRLRDLGEFRLVGLGAALDEAP